VAASKPTQVPSYEQAAATPAVDVSEIAAAVTAAHITIAPAAITTDIAATDAKNNPVNNSSALTAAGTSSIATDAETYTDYTSCLALDLADSLIADFRNNRSAELSEDGKRGYPELHTAVRFAEVPAVSALLEQDARMRAEKAKEESTRTPRIPLAQIANFAGKTALHWAASSSSAGDSELSIARLLLEHGAAPGDASVNGHTPLYEAARHGHAAMVTLLIEAGSPVESADEFRLTPLHIAAKHGHQAAAQRLCSVGADLTAQTHDGHTPLALALQARDEARMAGEPHSGLEDTIRLLRGRGARELSPCADGSKLPSDLVLDCGFPPAKVNLADRVAGKKVLVVGLPGAFTPT